jgi:hypothetical protein
VTTSTGPARPTAQPARQHAGTTSSRVLGRLRRRTTPDSIRALTTAAVGVSIVLGVLVATIFASVSSGLQLIGHQAAPEVVATTNLYFHLNDMDAQTANVLLVGDRSGLGIDRQQAQGIYASDETQANRALQQAAAVAGTSPAAQRALRSVLNGLGKYEALAAEAMYIDGAAAGSPGRPPAAALAIYRQATDEMRTALLPAARSLTNLNAAALTTAYRAKRSTAQTGALAVAVTGLALLAALIGLQFFLAARCRRLLNPALAAATLICLVLTVVGVTALSAQASHLRVAKVEAFNSILALSQARAVSYDANADESRFLVDPGRAAEYQQAFLTKSLEIVDLGHVGIFQYDAAMARAVDAYHANHADVTFGGYLGTEFRNITFPGERAAAQKTLAAFQVYQRDDRHIRALNRAGNLSGAIAFDTSYAHGNSNWAFTRYDRALESVIAINQRAFAAAIHAGQQGVRGWTGLIPGGAVVVIIILVVAGIRPRLAEYS